MLQIGYGEGLALARRIAASSDTSVKEDVVGCDVSRMCDEEKGRRESFLLITLMFCEI